MVYRRATSADGCATAGPPGGLRKVTAVSPTAAEEYVRLLGWHGKVEVIDNGTPPIARSVELRVDVRRSLDLADDTFVFLAVGNVKPEKGFNDLLAAAASLRELAAGRKFAVLIAGGAADAECYAGLIARHKALGLDGVVQFLGFRPDTPALYSAADAFVLSSRKEGLPMVLLEAMSSGLPVTATVVGAVPEVIRPNTDGLLVAPTAVDALAHAMYRIMAEPALRVSLGKAARARIAEQYSVPRMAERYLEVYAVAAGGGRSTAAPAGVAGERPAVLMLGPLPPLTGGMATVACNLRDSELSQWCELETINTGKTTPEGRPFLAGIRAQMQLLYKILSNIRQRRVRVVHIHTCALFSFWRDIVHMMAVRAIGCRVIWHLHDGTFLRFISEGSRLKRAVIRWALHRGAATIVLSDEALHSLRPYAPRVRWRVVLNGVPLYERRRNDASPLEPANTALKLLFLGNLTRRKGAYDLIAAVEAASKQGVRAVVMLAGGTTAPEQREALERRIAHSPCGGDIRFLGVVQGAEKRDALAEADCIVLPSYAEGLPMAILEGMAAGLPALATRIGSVPALIDDGVEGFSFSPGDVDALAADLCSGARLHAPPPHGPSCASAWRSTSARRRWRRGCIRSTSTH